MSRFGRTIAWGAAALLLALALIYGLNHFIPAPATETGTPVVSTQTPLTTATLPVVTSTPVVLGLPRYENVEYGFHFNYPQGFRLVEQAVEDGILLSIGLALETDTTAETGLMPINVTVYENFAGQALLDGGFQSLFVGLRGHVGLDNFSFLSLLKPFCVKAPLSGREGPGVSI